MLDRKIQPAINPIADIEIPKADLLTLNNEIPLYSLHFGNEDVVRIDCIFRAGIYYQQQPLVASFANQLLKEGTQTKNSAQIAERLDFYGSWLQLSCSHHFAYVTLYSLNKYLPETIDLLKDMIENSVFPEKEFQIYLNRRKQQYLIEQEKVQYLAQKEFQTALYGNHPYGKSANIDDFDRLQVAWIQDFHKQFYTPQNCRIVVSGKVNSTVLNCIENSLGKIENNSSFNMQDPYFQPTTSIQHHLFVEKKNSVQAAIKIGRPLFDRKHPDFHKFRILSTVLGGYFGSRLMANIREEKGYTYGISSGITTYLDAGHFYIATQTGVEFTDLLIEEVYKEMEKLCSELIPQEELNMVKSYMLGEHIRMFDGGFALADTFISMLVNNLDYSFYEQNAAIIRSTEAKELQELAVRYFDPNEFYNVIAGGTEKK